MTPGIVAQVREEWRHLYRAHGTAIAGVVQAVSPSGKVARLRLDEVADSYILVSHLEPAPLGAMLEPEPVAART